jgi:hypothetical protein
LIFCGHTAPIVYPDRKQKSSLCFTVTDSMFSDLVSYYSGGGIYVSECGFNFSIRDSTFKNCSAPRRVGADDEGDTGAGGAISTQADYSSILRCCGYGCHADHFGKFIQFWESGGVNDLTRYVNDSTAYRCAPDDTPGIEHENDGQNNAGGSIGGWFRPFMVANTNFTCCFAGYAAAIRIAGSPLTAYHLHVAGCGNHTGIEITTMAATTTIQDSIFAVNVVRDGMLYARVGGSAMRVENCEFFENLDGGSSNPRDLGAENYYSPPFTITRCKFGALQNPYGNLMQADASTEWGQSRSDSPACGIEPTCMAESSGTCPIPSQTPAVTPTATVTERPSSVFADTIALAWHRSSRCPQPSPPIFPFPDSFFHPTFSSILKN